MRWLTLLVGLGDLCRLDLRHELLPAGFMPDEDTARIVVRVELPPGAGWRTRAVTDRAVDG